MRSRPVAAGGETVQHVAEVADDQLRVAAARRSTRRRPSPAARRCRRGRAVSATRSRCARPTPQRSSPSGGCGGYRKMRNSGVGSAVRSLRKKSGVNPSPSAISESTCWASGSIVAIHSVITRSQRRRLGRPDVGAVHGPGINRQLAAEVVALLQIRHARRQLAAEREPSAPRGPTAGEGNAVPSPARSGRRSRSPRSSTDSRSSSADAVIADGEEPELPARPIDLAWGCRRSDVDDRQHAPA